MKLWGNQQLIQEATVPGQEIIVLKIPHKITKFCFYIWYFVWIRQLDFLPKLFLQNPAQAELNFDS